MNRDKHSESKHGPILWAPWRMEYIENCEQSGTCIFCDKPKEDNDRQNLMICRGKESFVIMNRYPYNNGHLMIVPYQHTDQLGALSESEKVELFDFLVVSKKVLEEVMNPQGFNIGMNLGRTAGAGIDDPSSAVYLGTVLKR